MSSEPNSVNIKSEKFEKTVNELFEIVSDNSHIPQQLQITLQELNDGYANNVASLSEIFIEAVRRKKISLPASFKKIPITNSIENYPYPIVLLNDEQELDAETQKIVRKRSEKGYVTFPVILLSDQFFRLSYGEKFSYKEIIKVFEDSAKETVMVFRRTEFKFLEEYICIIKHLFLIYNYRELISEIRKILTAEADELSVNIDNLNAISGLVLTQRIKAILQIDNELERTDKKFEKQIIEWQAEINAIREKYDKKVLEEITHIKADDISPFVLDIDLKYVVLQGYIKEFLMLREIGLDYDFLTDDLKRLVSETQTSISSNKAKLSLIGTFSSGKTTLINTFLGKREIPLRTSMGHNTAVLMHLFHEKTDKEYYDIIYKEKLTWTVVKPASMDKAIVNKEKENIRILSVEQNASGNYLIYYSVGRSMERHSIRIRTNSGIAVKRGDVLKPRAPFTIMGKQISKTVEICSRAEIELLIKLIKSSGGCNLQNADESITNKNNILNLLKKIYDIASEKKSTKTYEQFCKDIGLNPLRPNTIAGQNKSSYPAKFRKIVVECKVGKDNERKMLDRKGWLELCGDPNPNTDKKDLAFSEQPECYMLAKELQLHVNTEFLQYCSLTDTPGFGSVTEEHDAITEKYIRDSSGRMLVMIAINAKTIDAKYQDLINSIDDIYNNFRKADKKNVVFILNCFTNLTPEANIRSQVENVYQMLVKYGFNRNNIFVCNLKGALDDKQQLETMYGHPSYKKFHDFIISEMISSDLTAKYRGIQSDWNLFFKDSGKRIDYQIYDYESNLNDLQQRREELQNILKSLEKFSVDNLHFDSDSVKDEFQLMYDILSDAYIYNRKGFFDDVRWNAILKALNTVESSLKICNDELIDSIYDYYKQCIGNISYYGESQISLPELDYPQNSVAVLELEHLKNLLSEADDETHWYNKSRKNDYYTDKILNIIQEGFDQTIEKANELCSDYANIARNYKDSIVREKESALKGMENENKMKASMNKLKIVKKNLAELEIRFGKIKFI